MFAWTRDEMTDPRVDGMAEAFTGVAAWPRDNDEPIFAQPWEGRAFGLAFDVVTRLGLPWEEFRTCLIAALSDDPQRSYYESWVRALERFVLCHAAVDPTELEGGRLVAARYRYHESGAGDIEVYPVTRGAEALATNVPDMDSTEAESCVHVELYRTITAADPAVPGTEVRCGLRAFDGRDVKIVDRALTPASWEQARRELL